MRYNYSKIFVGICVCFLGLILGLEAKSDKIRLIIRTNPAKSMTIGWCQSKVSEATLYYGTTDYGTDWKKYPIAKGIDKTTTDKGMTNCFVRLTELSPDTKYFFVIKDAKGCTKRYWFKTLSDKSDTRFSIIAGGDSRNNKKARQNANRLVAKLRPDCVMFGGDMTLMGTDKEWTEWLNDWQLTIASDGRLTPVIVSRGNHESDNACLVGLFDVPNPDVYYAVTLGGSLLRLYTLNTLIPVKGDQSAWLEADLKRHAKYTWRIVQYHHPMRPHTKYKKGRDDIRKAWCPYFKKYKVKLAVECDTHVAKYTYPIIASNTSSSEDGFIRSERYGTTYVGEGGWGAPLRPANNERSWTLDSKSINHFQWIWVDKTSMEIRTVKTDDAAWVSSLKDDDRFTVPNGLILWKLKNCGKVLTLKP